MASFHPSSVEINVFYTTKNASHSEQATVPITKSHLQVGSLNTTQDNTVSSGFSDSELPADHVASDHLQAQSPSPDVQNQMGAVVQSTPLAGIHAPKDVHAVAIEEIAYHDKGKFIPQVALDLEKEFGGFSYESSFMMEPELATLSITQETGAHGKERRKTHPAVRATPSIARRSGLSSFSTTQAHYVSTGEVRRVDLTAGNGGFQKTTPFSDPSRADSDKTSNRAILQLTNPVSMAKQIDSPCLTHSRMGPKAAATFVVKHAVVSSLNPAEKAICPIKPTFPSVTHNLSPYACSSSAAAYVSNGSCPPPTTSNVQLYTEVQPTTHKSISVDSQIASHMAVYVSAPHTIAGHNSKEAYHLCSYAPHKNSKGPASLVNDVIPYGSQQFPSTVLKDADHADMPSTEIAPGPTVSQLQLSP
ncbi:hypothetical protein F0562_032274 [Nyssa sinensis]|uniref:Uncharacterized protein n=1 Tax=Nyssa sinensis TaxID=561372 RepID=A0A5J5AT97_9ASTE|nr:hypothetical protein F0562_032274 [Nyssa sinensis]